MKPGVFLFHPNFRFKNGTVGRKILVVLNDGAMGTYIVLKTTSKGERFGITFGCQIEERFPNFYLPKNSCCLDVDTWVQLEEFYEFDRYDLVNRILQQEIHRFGELPECLTIKLLKCAVRAEDITPWQEEQLWAEIAKLGSAE